MVRNQSALAVPENMTLLLSNGTLSNKGNVSVLHDRLSIMVDQVVDALGAEQFTHLTPLGKDVVAATIFVICMWSTCILILCYRSKAVHCNCSLWSYYCGEFWCRRICCRRPLAEQEDLARGPDQAIEEHQDENAETDSIDEPVRRTPPGTDGEEEEEEEDVVGRPPSPSRASCSDLAAAMASADALAADSNGGTVAAVPAADAPASAPADAPSKWAASSKSKGKRVAGKSVAFLAK